MRKFIILLLISTLTVTGAVAQYYDTGQDPASLRWRQIRTPHFRIIFPEDFAAGAAEYSRLLEDSYSRLSPLYPDISVSVPVIIHSHSMLSNGYLSWAPRRMELYPLPGQYNLPMSPARQLAVHETTHVLQLASLNRRGLGRAVWYLLGEQAVGLSAVEIPMWAFEGDAVYAETVTGISGRGRSNAFLQEARALATRPRGIYGYDKMLAGSYRHFTPDYYVFGYLMMNHLRNRDSSAWISAVRKVAGGYPLNPVNRSLREETGLTKKRLYDSAFAALEKRWREADKHGYTAYPSLNVTARRDHVNHYIPHRTGDGSIISLKSSLSAPTKFVITEDSGGKEHVITTTGYIYPYIFSYSDSTVVWSELHRDIRWDNRDFSVIKKMSLSGGGIVQLTRRTRYAAPDLSPDGRTIVAVSTTPGLRCSLVFLDAFTGEVLMDLVPPENLFIQRPAWSSDGSAVTIVTLSDSGEGIRTYRPTGKRWTVNLAEGPTDIIQAEIYNDTLFYLAQGDGSDNIYRITNDTVVTRVTRSRYGISGFSVHDGEILFSDYSADGFVIASEKSSADAGEPSGSMNGVIPDLAPMASAGAGAAPVTGRSTIPDPAPVQTSPEEHPEGSELSIPPSEPYSKIAHLFNFHSWFPFYGDIDLIRTDPTSIRPGVTLMSQNHLSTLITTVGYEYSEETHRLHTGIRWSGWHPVIEADISFGGERIIRKDTASRPDPTDIAGDMIITASIYDQLWFAYGKFRQLFMPALYVSYRNAYTYIREEQAYDRGFAFVTGRLYFSNTFRVAYRDINPRWGQVADIRITSAPFDRDIYGSRRYARGTLYFPGLFRNHSLVLRAGHEDQAPFGTLLYNNALSYPRGYNETVVSEKLTSFSADYTMPLFYPDLAVGSLLYLKRIRGSAFYDVSRGENTYNYGSRIYTEGYTGYSSFGAELLADFYILRFPFEISAGATAGYIPAQERLFMKGTISANIYGTVLGRER